MYQLMFDISWIVLTLSLTALGLFYTIRRLKKYSKWLFIPSAIFLVATIVFAILKKSETDQEAFLSNPIQDLRITVVFNRLIALDSLQKSQIRFQLKSANGRLDLRAQIFDATLQSQNAPLQINAAPRPNWFLGISQIPTNSAITTHSVHLKKLISDTLEIPIELNGLQVLPFRTIRDFNGMFFTPYISGNLVALAREFSLTANQRTIIKSQADEAFWAPVIWVDDTVSTNLQMPVATDPHNAGKRPDELWQIDLRK